MVVRGIEMLTEQEIDLAITCVKYRHRKAKAALAYMSDATKEQEDQLKKQLTFISDLQNVIAKLEQLKTGV